MATQGEVDSTHEPEADRVTGSDAPDLGRTTTPESVIEVGEGHEIGRSREGPAAACAMAHHHPFLPTACSRPFPPAPPILPPDPRTATHPTPP